jgi:hypothetical protein
MPVLTSDSIHSGQVAKLSTTFGIVPQCRSPASRSQQRNRRAMWGPIHIARRVKLVRPEHAHRPRDRMHLHRAIDAFGAVTARSVGSNANYTDAFSVTNSFTAAASGSMAGSPSWRMWLRPKQLC